MPLLTWSDSYSVGIKAMDTEHQKLAELVNQLYDAMKVGKGNEIMGNVLNALVQYTQTHFGDEERLMQRHGFPSFAQHKSLHEALTKQVLEVHQQFKAGRAAITVQIMTFLKDWLVKHIQGSDREYGVFLNQKGIQ